MEFLHKILQQLGGGYSPYTVPQSSVYDNIEYCGYIWSNGSILYLDIIDKIQRRTCKFICPDNTFSVTFAIPWPQREFHVNIFMVTVRIYFRFHKFNCSTRLAVRSLVVSLNYVLLLSQLLFLAVIRWNYGLSTNS